jgi:hypothetical protein
VAYIQEIDALVHEQIMRCIPIIALLCYDLLPPPSSDDMKSSTASVILPLPFAITSSKNFCVGPSASIIPALRICSYCRRKIFCIGQFVMSWHPVLACTLRRKPHLVPPGICACTEKGAHIFLGVPCLCTG